MLKVELSNRVGRRTLARQAVMLHGRMMPQKIGLWQNRGCLKILEFRKVEPAARGTRDVDGFV